MVFQMSTSRQLRWTGREEGERHLQGGHGQHFVDVWKHRVKCSSSCNAQALRHGSAPCRHGGGEMPPPAEQWGGSALITACACAYSKGGCHERLQVILLMRLNHIFNRDMWRRSFAIQQMLVYVNSFLRNHGVTECFGLEGTFRII